LTSTRKLEYIVSVIAIMDALTAVIAVLKAPFPLKVDLGAPTAYISIYVHVPLAWASYLLFAIAMIGGILYLVKGKDEYEKVTVYATLLGIMYGFGTIVTGMAWAKESWGAAWNWDPRETGVLLLLLAYLGYFAIRNSIRDPEKRKTISSAYAIAAFMAVPISFISAYIGDSLHPTSSQAGSFFGQPQVMMYFIPRVLLASATVIGLVTLLVKGDGKGSAPRIAGGLILILGILTTIYLVSPYITSHPERVLNATLAGDKISSIVTPKGVIEFKPPVDSPVQPASYKGEPTIIGHLVTLNGNSLNLVVHWSASFALVTYSIILGVVLTFVYRLSRNI